MTVVHLMPWLMERQLDRTAGKLLQKSLEARGLKFRIGAQTEALIGDRDAADAAASRGAHLSRAAPRRRCRPTWS